MRRKCEDCAHIKTDGYSAGKGVCYLVHAHQNVKGKAFDLGGGNRLPAIPGEVLSYAESV